MDRNPPTTRQPWTSPVLPLIHQLMTIGAIGLTLAIVTYPLVAERRESTAAASSERLVRIRASAGRR
jgi:hypothetical protein